MSSRQPLELRFLLLNGVVGLDHLLAKGGVVLVELSGINPGFTEPPLEASQCFLFGLLLLFKLIGGADGGLKLGRHLLGRGVRG
ncbi:hypothetical protein C1X73_20020 [Pseudomonas sp. FW305-130]|nr:hypothetical protein C1X74_21050 [Pseudomonas sp. GW460-5]PNB56154.1 hypothetical protein C1X73_20020 [Pseudomonas sp. FW305-130]